MKRIMILLIAGLLGLSFVACDEDSDIRTNGTDADIDVDKTDGADDFDFSCHYNNPYTFEPPVQMCFGINDVDSLEEAQQICDDAWLGDVQHGEDGAEIGSNKILDGKAKEGGCLSVAEGGFGYCTSHKGNKNWSAGSFDPMTGDRMTSEQDCDIDMAQSSAWGCDTVIGQTAGPSLAGEWKCYE